MCQHYWPIYYEDFKCNIEIGLPNQALYFINRASRDYLIDQRKFKSTRFHL